MPFFDGIKGRVYYKTWQPEVPVAGVVFLHGFGEHSGLYHRYGAALNARAVALWALDEIGHGLTEGERGVVESLDDLVENGQRLTSIAERQVPELPLVVAGHSLGGVTAALTAVRHPERYVGVVLSGAPLSPLAWAAEGAGGSSGSDDGGGVEAGGVDLALDDLSADPFYLDELENDPLAFTSGDLTGTTRRTMPPAWSELEARFGSVPRPVLFVHGGDDPIAPVESTRSWVARVPNGRLAEFAGARHDVLNETVHREVAARITDFVLEVSGQHPRNGGDAAGVGSSR